MITDICILCLHKEPFSNYIFIILLISGIINKTYQKSNKKSRAAVKRQRQKKAITQQYNFPIHKSKIP